MQRWCQSPKSKGGCPGVPRPKYTLSSTGFPCFWDHTDLSCAWCVGKQALQCDDSVMGDNCGRYCSSGKPVISLSVRVLKIFSLIFHIKTFISTSSLYFYLFHNSDFIFQLGSDSAEVTTLTAVSSPPVETEPGASRARDAAVVDQSLWAMVSNVSRETVPGEIALWW